MGKNIVLSPFRPLSFSVTFPCGWLKLYGKPELKTNIDRITLNILLCQLFCHICWLGGCLTDYMYNSSDMTNRAQHGEQFQYPKISLIRESQQLAPPKSQRWSFTYFSPPESWVVLQKHTYGMKPPKLEHILTTRVKSEQFCANKKTLPRSNRFSEIQDSIRNMLFKSIFNLGNCSKWKCWISAPLQSLINFL